jgi:hypothetical protein
MRDATVGALARVPARSVQQPQRRPRQVVIPPGEQFVPDDAERRDVPDDRRRHEKPCLRRGRSEVGQGQRQMGKTLILIDLVRT